MAHLRWLPVLLLSLSVVGGCRGRRFGDDVGESATPSFGDALWRIKEELGGFGLVVSVPDPDRFFYCPSLVLVGAGAGVYGGDLWRFVYQIEKSGWCLDPTFSGGFASLFGCLLLRRVGVDAACGVGYLLHRRRDGLRPSFSACTFIDFTACWIPQCATLSAISKL